MLLLFWDLVLYLFDTIIWVITSFYFVFGYLNYNRLNLLEAGLLKKKETTKTELFGDYWDWGKQKLM